VQLAPACFDLLNQGGDLSDLRNVHDHEPGGKVFLVGDGCLVQVEEGTDGRPVELDRPPRPVVGDKDRRGQAELLGQMDNRRRRHLVAGAREAVSIWMYLSRTAKPSAVWSAFCPVMSTRSRGGIDHWSASSSGLRMRFTVAPLR
jgi:hypothetical protein